MVMAFGRVVGILGLAAVMHVTLMHSAVVLAGLWHPGRLIPITGNGQRCRRLGSGRFSGCRIGGVVG
jgi:hypothetical protein